ncbi:MAG TPA: sulfotransferase [Hyphomonadaceae bacterium]|nr:sulfotransferase [Hyphomonadaceae bacterium]
MGLQVIGAGFGRTGTMSLKIALEMLGYVKCHHMVEVLSSDSQAVMWRDIGEGKQTDWDKVFDGFAACVDFPACVVYKELADKYPDAKVILTIRSTESWWTSASQTIFAIGKAMPGWMKALLPRIRNIFAMHEALLDRRMFGGKMRDESAAKAVYERHNADVQKVIPANRLLVYEVKQGWDPLCAFLGKPVPDKPFPNVNDMEEFKARIRMLRIINWAVPVGLLIVLGLAGWGYVALTSGHPPT